PRLRNRGARPPPKRRISLIFLRRAQVKAALGACLSRWLSAFAFKTDPLPTGAIGRASDSQFPNSFISGNAVPTGMGGRGVSPVGAGGSGRSRSGIRLRAENTPLSWSAVGGGWGALTGGGSAAVTGRGWMSTGATGFGRTSGERG